MFCAFSKFCMCRTDGQMDGRTNKRTSALLELLSQLKRRKRKLNHGNNDHLSFQVTHLPKTTLVPIVGTGQDFMIIISTCYIPVLYLEHPYTYVYWGQNPRKNGTTYKVFQHDSCQNKLRFPIAISLKFILSPDFLKLQNIVIQKIPQHDICRQCCCLF